MNLMNLQIFQFPFSARLKIRVALVMLSAVGFMTLIVGIQVLKITDNTRVLQQVMEQSVEQRFAIRNDLALLRYTEFLSTKYILTGEVDDLANFRKLQIDVAAQSEEIPARFDVSETQHDRALRLVELVSAWMKDLDRMVSAVAEGKPSAGKVDEALMVVPAPIRDLVTEMTAFAEEDIGRASKIITDQIRHSQLVSVVTVMFVTLIVAAVLLHGLAYLSIREKVETALREANRLAEEASAAKTDFLATMSHEIRTPLASVLGFTELLLSGKLTARQRELSEHIQTAGTNLCAIVNDILDFSKVEAGLIAPDPKPFPLQHLVDNVLSIVSVTAEQKKLELRRQIDPNLPVMVSGDEPRLRQVLLNLLSNAIKFTHTGNIVFAMHREGSTDEGEKIRIEVSDTGIGFGPEKRDLLFKRFSQLDSSIRREFGGSGLGLAISKELVEMMGGQIGVESVKGIGTKFWITLTLPLAAGTEGAAIESQPKNTQMQVGRILLVEDSKQNQELISIILRSAGHQVDVASDGIEAIEMVQASQYDLVLMDVQMPRMDGPTATRTIRDLDHPASQTPIVALTANVLPEQVSGFRKVGMNDFIAKPFKSADLLTKVSAWVKIGYTETSGQIESPAQSSVYDTQTLTDIRDLMGDAWVVTALKALSAEISDTFRNVQIAKLDETELREKAHRIVSHSAQLGFHELSRYCSKLEELCLTGGNIGPAFRLAQHASNVAVEKVEEIIETNLVS